MVAFVRFPAARGAGLGRHGLGADGLRARGAADFSDSNLGHRLLSVRRGHSLPSGQKGPGTTSWKTPDASVKNHILALSPAEDGGPRKSHLTPVSSRSQRQNESTSSQIFARIKGKKYI